MLRTLRSLSLVLATAGLVLAPAAAHAAPSAKKVTAAKKTTKASSKKSTLTYPSVSKVTPLKLGIGDKLVLRGKSFRVGKNKNFVVFKRDGGRALFVKADKATRTTVTVTVPAKLLTFFTKKKGAPVPTRFKLRVMAAKLGKKYTKTAQSPLISPVSGAASPASDCDSDGVANAKDTDDDNDLLIDTEEARLGTNPCARDSDADGMSDGWEQQSAIDRNGGGAMPAPYARPYPNALDPADGATDSDGDGLSNLEEYTAWATYGANKLPLSYSGGNPTSAGRGAPQTWEEINLLDRDRNHYLSDFERDADGDGISNMDEMRTGMNMAAITVSQSDDDTFFHDFGLFTTKYIELAAEATESVRCAGINQVPFYCVDKMQPALVKVQKVDPLEWLANDSDGDTVSDGFDDQDHDDVANIDEYKRFVTSTFKTRRYDPLDACVPNADSRFCLLGSADADNDGLVNSVDLDDDNDLVSDADELANSKSDPLLADTDGDGVSDGFEYYSALDLNGAAPYYPGKRPAPNPNTGADGDLDFDSDSLTLREEYKAWRLTGGTLPLTYSDGTQHTGGRIAATNGTTWDKYDHDDDGWIRDDEKDVDGDFLSNYVETHGPLASQSWYTAYANAERNKCNPSYVESEYPGPKYAGLNFVDPDTDGDGIVDGKDDSDFDGYNNWFETWRPGMDAFRNAMFAGGAPGTEVFAGPWCSTYTSTAVANQSGTGTHINVGARVNPFNPCKPTMSDYCHRHEPQGYYGLDEDWESDFDGTLAVDPSVYPWNQP